MWWIFVLANAIPTAVLGIIVVWLYIRLNKRADIYEAATTMRLDQLLQARRDQLAAEALQRAYGVPARASRPFVPSRSLVTSRPLPRTTLPPLADPWHEWPQNGHAAE